MSVSSLDGSSFNLKRSYFLVGVLVVLIRLLTVATVFSLVSLILHDWDSGKPAEDCVLLIITINDIIPFKCRCFFLNGICNYPMKKCKYFNQYTKQFFLVVVLFFRKDRFEQMIIKY